MVIKIYTSYYGMNTNPFVKSESIKYPFESHDFIETNNRFNYLKDIKGIGLFIGTSGLGKTFAIRHFINNLNKDLYKVIYINATHNMTEFDFLKYIASELNIDINCYRSNNYTKIQQEIKRLYKSDKVQLIIIIDDAHLLSRNILLNFKILYDFDMDSNDYVTLILVGYPELRVELNKSIHEALKQRIVVNYEFNGLNRLEVKDYIADRLTIANTSQEIFSETALNALYSCSKSSPRRLNTLIVNCLMLGSQNNMSVIDENIVMDAKGEMDID